MVAGTSFKFSRWTGRFISYSFTACSHGDDVCQGDETLASGPVARHRLPGHEIGHPREPQGHSRLRQRVMQEEKRKNEENA